MCVRVHAQKGQDDGNKRKQCEAESHGNAQNLLITPPPVNP